MQTVCCRPTQEALAEAARLIGSGGLVGFPTETVYGLGADGLCDAAVRDIYAAKGRPADNPLILHVADWASATRLVADPPEAARLLAAAFWPGPLTLVLPAAPCVPEVVRAGLPTVGVRCPAHPVAQALIQAAGVPIAAPSANRSGRPGPTCAQDVLADMDGRISLILDGGPCSVGVESTVLDLTSSPPCVLRPGGVTVDMLLAVLPEVAVHPSALSPAVPGQAKSPGMLHRHYAPRARVVVFDAGQAAACKAAVQQARQAGERPFVLASRETLAAWGEEPNVRCWGDRDRPQDLAAALFTSLRRLDDAGATLILCEGVAPEGLGLAVMNRLLRAADFCRLE